MAVCSAAGALLLASIGLLDWLPAVIVVALLGLAVSYRYEVPFVVRALDAAARRSERTRRREPRTSMSAQAKVAGALAIAGMIAIVILR